MENNRFKDSFADADKDFEEQLDKLKKLSDEEVAAITPDTASAQVYQDLIGIVKEASENNWERARLIGKIKGLGEIAVQIVRKYTNLIPSK